MFVGVCAECKHVDLINGESESVCARCSGRMLSLDISTSEWNKLSNDEMIARINKELTKNKEEIFESETKKADEIMTEVEDVQDSEISASKTLIESIEDEFIEENENYETIIDEGSNEEKTYVSQESEQLSPEMSESVVKKKVVGVNNGSQISKKVNANDNKKYPNSGIVGGAPLLIILGPIIVAFCLVLLAIYRNSSIGGILVVLSTVIPFRKTFMNGYDMFEKTPKGLAFIVWVILIVISMVCIVTSHRNI